MRRTPIKDPKRYHKSFKANNLLQFKMTHSLSSKSLNIFVCLCCYIQVVGKGEENLNLGFCDQPQEVGNASVMNWELVKHKHHHTHKASSLYPFPAL